MLKNLLFVSFFLVLAVSFSSCKKNKASAEFYMSQYEYVAGDALMVENLSLKYDSCQWEMIAPNGDVVKTVTGNHPNLVTGILFKNGIHTLRLTTFLRKKVHSTEKEFLIKSDHIYLKVNAYSNSQADQDEYDVYIDGQFAGSANNYGIYSEKIPVGWRYVKLVAPNETLADTYYFDSNEYAVAINF